MRLVLTQDFSNFSNFSILLPPNEIVNLMFCNMSLMHVQSDLDLSEGEAFFCHKLTLFLSFAYYAFKHASCVS